MISRFSRLFLLYRHSDKLEEEYRLRAKLASISNRAQFLLDYLEECVLLKSAPRYFPLFLLLIKEGGKEGEDEEKEEEEEEEEEEVEEKKEKKNKRKGKISLSDSGTEEKRKEEEYVRRRRRRKRRR
ncbi:hypothetical protein E2C01_039424 [Portunus trituberculatus]|uniref:Uncharacterized protein n=1 Tax=Portunus trituberculatus TaxID=210409 RepID=A0A5B7FLB9_PORTR|nr:hypothetical protein [Portunus trituberculatus]